MQSKIFIVIDNLGIGGAQRQVLEYIKYSDRERFLIKVVNMDAGYNIIGSEIESLGCEVISIDHKGFFNISTLIRLFTAAIENLSPRAMTINGIRRTLGVPL